MSTTARSLRRHRRTHREMINGRMVSTIAPRHGDAVIYGTYSCRCIPCTRANSAVTEKQRLAAYSKRVMVQNRWVYPPGPHGEVNTYQAKGCRCIQCVAAVRVDRHARQGR